MLALAATDRNFYLTPIVLVGVFLFMDMENAIELRDNAKQQLMEIQTIEQATDYINKVKSVETYLKATKQDDELLKLMQEQKIRSQRIAGQILQESQVSKNYGGINVGNEPLPTQKLSDLGITKNESSTYQKIASIPEDVFEAEMEKAKEGDSTTDITTSRFKRLANNDNHISEKLSHEKQLKKYASLLGFKLTIINPDLILLTKHNRDVENIKLLYNQN